MVTKVLVDTNILIDLMNGVPKAKVELGYFSDFAISSLTWMGVMVGCKTQADTLKFETFLKMLNVQVVHPDDAIMATAVTIRSAGLTRTPKRKIKAPDAIIGATAKVLGRVVITRNPADFEPSQLRVPYKLKYQKDDNSNITGWIASDIADAPE
jgi:predicted nucleic acid-binding protein